MIVLFSAPSSQRLYAECSPTESAKLTASDAAFSDLLGTSVAVSGDTAVVGAYTDDTAAGTDAGSAYVFARSGGVWTQQAHLFASDGAPFDNFGISVAVFGETAIVGAYGDDLGLLNNAGSAYVFVRSGAVWTQQAKLTASDGSTGDFLGSSVALSGNTAIVGAYTESNANGAAAGAAYVFVRSGTVWSEQSKLLPLGGSANALFGVSVAVDGDNALVGSYRHDPNGVGDAGGAFVFVRSGTVWSQQAELNASDAATIDNFGYSVALSGNTALVGALNDDATGGVDSGSAYVYQRSGTAWSEQAHLQASDTAAADNFGVSVALEDDTAVVGSYYDDGAAGTDAGSTYVYVRSGSTWSEKARLKASDGSAFDNFGRSVAISNGTGIVGAYGDDLATTVSAGSAYVFDLLPFEVPGDINGDQQANGLDVAIFTGVVLGSDTDAAHRGRADLDCSGTADSDDIPLIVAALLGT